MSWGSSHNSPVDDVIGVLLRTPGLFIIDYWWKYQKNPFYFESKTNFITNLVTHVGMFFCNLSFV